MTSFAAPHYVKPGAFTRHVFNPIVAAITRISISVWGSRVLEVRGRTSGEWRRTPVNLLVVDGERYLVAPRGETQWVRNVRAADSFRLRVGRRVETVSAVEVPDGDKVAVLRPYLRLWKWEVGQFFDGLDADATDEAMRAAAPKHPIFRLVAVTAAS